MSSKAPVVGTPIASCSGEIDTLGVLAESFG